jgi:arginine/lysine/histidine transport system ATP-binding protein
MGFARKVTSRIMFLDQGSLAEDTTPGKFFLKPECVSVAGRILWA